MISMKSECQGAMGAGFSLGPWYLDPGCQPPSCCPSAWPISQPSYLAHILKYITCKKLCNWVARIHLFHFSWVFCVWVICVWNVSLVLHVACQSDLLMVMCPSILSSLSNTVQEWRKWQRSPLSPVWSRGIWEENLISTMGNFGFNFYLHQEEIVLHLGFQVWG